MEEAGEGFLDEFFGIWRPFPVNRVPVNEMDIDGDGVPNFADGYNLDGVAGNADDRNDVQSPRKHECGGRLELTLHDPLWQLPDLAGQGVVTFGYAASGPAGVTYDPATRRYTPAPGRLRIWTKHSFVDGEQPGDWSPRSARSVADPVVPGHFVPSGVPIKLAALGLSSDNPSVPLFVEGIAPSPSYRGDSIEVVLDPDGPGPLPAMCRDRLRVTVVRTNPDLHVDSDNDSPHGTPGRTPAEDAIEDSAPGKLISLNDDDDDADGLPDNEDYDNPNEDDFVPMVLELPEHSGFSSWYVGFSFWLEYDPARLRVWIKPGNVPRDPRPCWIFDEEWWTYHPGGHFVAPFQTYWSWPAWFLTLGDFRPGGPPLTLYVEALEPSAEPGDARVAVHTFEYNYYVNASLGSDAVRLTAVGKKPDIDIEGVAEEDEETLGAVVGVKREGNIAPRRMIVLDRGRLAEGNVVLSRSSAKVLVFTESEYGEELTFNGTDNRFEVSSLPRFLWVEGTAPSEGVRDVRLTLRADVPGRAEVVVAFTVVGLDLKASYRDGSPLREADEEDPGGFAQVNNDDDDNDGVIDSDDTDVRDTTIQPPAEKEDDTVGLQADFTNGEVLVSLAEGTASLTHCGVARTLWGKRSKEEQELRDATYDLSNDGCREAFLRELSGRTVWLEARQPGEAFVSLSYRGRDGRLVVEDKVKVNMLDIEYVSPQYDASGAWTGELRPKGGLCGLSDPAPVVDLEEVRPADVSLEPNGQATVRVRGRVRDRIADIVKDGAADIETVTLTVNGQQMGQRIELSRDSAYEEANRSLARPYAYQSETFEVELKFTAQPGMNLIEGKTSQNAAGNVGYDSISVYAVEQSLPPGVPLVAVLEANVVVPEGAFMPNVLGKVRVYWGHEGEAAGAMLTETAPDSMRLGAAVFGNRVSGTCA